MYNMTINYKNNIYIPIIICILYAISDEIHQLFVPGRSGQVSDVLLDTLGAFTGIMIYKLIYNKIKGGKV